ncbi:MAG: putative protease YdcP [Candidatus Anoxychlamydiales bacterium]|nr:putative protease YdcP [Candidatus Anoxychlamydiales bacterium]NGX36565.1 putative protease YdcP [Candidatus Anoxychlamydiales bacterium]
MNQKPKVLAPAGYFDSLQAAIDAKADSIYFGVGSLNMRKSSSSFEITDLFKIAQICQENGVETNLTLNSVIYDEEIKIMKEVIDMAKDAKITAIIAHDMATIQYAREKGIKIHISTQANVSNTDAVRYYSQFSDLVVLARELSLEQVSNIVKNIEKDNIRGPSNNLVTIETFIHGALCSAISGKCYMSLDHYNKSANRGECSQSCRRKYKVIEEETNKELLLDNKYIMSLKDLCTIGQIDKLVSAGIKVFKIEGRARSPEYVYAVTKAYKEAIDAVYENTYTKEKIDAWIEELSNVYNRGFWHGGYYMGNQTDIWSGAHGSIAKEKKTYIGKATNFFSKLNVAEFLLHSHKVKIGDKILVIGPTTGVIKTKVTSLYTDKKVTQAIKGEKVAIAIEKKVRRNDKLYLIEKNDR